MSGPKKIIPAHKVSQTENTESSSSQHSIITAIKAVYAYLHPDYRARKLPHLIIEFPLVYSIYLTIAEIYSQDMMHSPSGKFISMCLFILAVVGAFFYPFALYWYKQSFINRVLSNIYFIGGIFQVMLRVLGTIVAGIVIAGFLSPVVGVRTWMKCKEQGLIIREEQDF